MSATEIDNSFSGHSTFLRWSGWQAGLFGFEMNTNLFLVGM